MQEQKGNSALSRLISEDAAEIRLAWRSAAEFDEVAVMHITGHGEQMLLSLSARIESGSGSESGELLRQLVGSPPWTGNEGEADSPLSLLVSLEETLTKHVASKPGQAGLAPEQAVLEVAQLVRRLAAGIDSLQREKVRQLEEKVATDPLTGAMSRAALLEHLETECARARRYARPLSVVFMDVDGLKATNDESGHRAGDDLLRRLSECVRGNTRAADLFGRLGGDEFLLVLPETDQDGATTVADKISGLLADEDLNATCGTAGTPQVEPEAETLIDAADTAMRALRASRGRG